MIEALREQNPTWSRWPIWLALQKQEFNISERTVGRILAYLERHRRIEKKAWPPSWLACSGGKVKRRRALRSCARRKSKDCVASSPGDLVWVATLTISLGPGEIIKHFSAVDLFTRFSLAEVHTRATSNLAAGFLAHFIANVPFPVRAIRVDGGSEFMAEEACWPCGRSEEACQRSGVELFVPPPNDSKLDGHVE